MEIWARNLTTHFTKQKPRHFLHGKILGFVITVKSIETPLHDLQNERN